VCGWKTEIGWRLNFFGSEDAAATPESGRKWENRINRRGKFFGEGFSPMVAYLVILDLMINNRIATE
jgi:hypothetical protein